MIDCRHWYICDDKGLIFCEKCKRSFTYGDANHLTAKIIELESGAEKAEAQIKELEKDAVVAGIIKDYADGHLSHVVSTEMYDEIERLER